MEALKRAERWVNIHQLDTNATMNANVALHLLDLWKLPSGNDISPLFLQLVSNSLMQVQQQKLTGYCVILMHRHFCLLLHRKAPRQRWSWAGPSPRSSLTSHSGRNCWRRRHRRSLRRRWCSRGISWRQPTSSPPLWVKRRRTPAVTNPSRWAAAFMCVCVCVCISTCVQPEEIRRN